MIVGEGSGSSEVWFGGLESPEGWTAFDAVAGQVVTSSQLSGLRPHVAFDQVGREVETLGVTSQYFRLLGQPIRGRDFTRNDNRVGAEPVAIISDRLWARAFDRRLDTIGLAAAAKPFAVRIIGVAPPGFQGARRGEQADVWIPSNLVPRVAPAGVNLQEDEAPVMAFARLHPGETLFEAKRRFVQDAVDELDRSSKQAMLVVPLADVFGAPDARTIVIGERRAGSVVAGLAGLVLLAGCATLMALVLVHYEQRRRELAVRIALGATRGRLATELSVELAWLAAGGTAGALLVAVWSLRILPALSLPGGVDLGRLDLSLDWRVLSAGLSITVLTLVAAALLPMARFTRASLAGELIAANSTTPASSQRLRQVLLGLHTAATIIVLIAAGLFVRAVIHGFGAGPGFDIDRMAYVQVQVVQPFFAGLESGDARLAAIDERTRRLDDGLRALPGVEEVAVGRSPIGQDQASYVLTPTLIETRGARRELRVGVLSGGWQLLPALGVRVLRGRALAAADASRRPYPALLTESLARTLWPTEEALGQVLSLGPRRGSFTVVGIVPDFVYGSLTLASSGVVVTVRPTGFGLEAPFVIRSRDPDALLQPVRRLVNAILPDAPRVVVSTGRDIVARDLGRQRLGAWFFSGFGLVALYLAPAVSSAWSPTRPSPGAANSVCGSHLVRRRAISCGAPRLLDWRPWRSAGPPVLFWPLWSCACSSPCFQG